jgi:hypothetical protein
MRGTAYVTPDLGTIGQLILAIAALLFLIRLYSRR